jgi:Uncharacterised protein family (UPF0158)
MTSVVRLQDVVDEMDAVSDEHHAYLNRQTGELVTIGDEEIRAVEEEHDLANYADWQQDAIQKTSQVLESDDYLRLPSKFDIHEYSIMQRFCDEVEDAELSNELLFQMRGSVAFQRFKHAIHRYDIADDWYRYRQAALEQIAIDWLEAHAIPYEINGDRPHSLPS